MSEKMMKVCGKNPQGNATALRMDADGNVSIRRVWETEQSDVCELVRNSSTLQANGIYAIYSNPFSVLGWGMVSLRIVNNLSVPVSFHLYSDRGQHVLAKNIDGDDITFNVAANSETIVTPDDFPVLNYLQSLSFRVAAENTSNSDEGKSVKVIAVMKR